MGGALSLSIYGNRPTAAPDIRAQIARRYYAKEKLTGPCGYNDIRPWTRISGNPPMMSARCVSPLGTRTVATVQPRATVQAPPKITAGQVVYASPAKTDVNMDSETKMRFDALERKLADLAGELKNVARKFGEAAKAISDTKEAVMTAAALEDVLKYTTVPVILTDQGPAPKRPDPDAQKQA